MSPPSSATTSRTLFRSGHNCWRVAPAERVGLLVDGEAYFRAVREAIDAARETILILGWDFDSRAALEVDASGRPLVTLGQALDRWVRRRAARHVFVLIWDYPMIYGLDREFPPIYGLGWKPHSRIHICYDGAIPVGASHHQKIVVMDDRVAFCGGIDLTGRRWDTSAHRAGDERRAFRGKPYPPVHDVMMAVSGDAAQTLGELARQRWKAASGRAIPPAGGAAPVAVRSRWRIRRRAATAPADQWPGSVPAAFTDTSVAIARTIPAVDGAEPVKEVEALYLDMIHAARRVIYIENQYFTADRLGAALVERLAEPDGPEIVVVVRLLSHGWLEALTMERLRDGLVRRLREADRHGRFHIYHPFVAGLPDEQCLDVHSKVLVVDDELLRIGSANFANRSLGFDSECDLAVEAGGDPDRAATIADFRTRLLAEHLGVEPERLAAAMEREGSLAAAIASLTRAPDSLAPDDRTLCPLEVKEHAGEAAPVLELADPEDPVPLDGLIEELRPSADLPVESGSAWLVTLGAALVLALLAALWRYTPLSSVASGEMIVSLARDTAAAPWTAPALVAGYVVATFVIFPRPLITLFAVLAFGPWIAFALAMAGVVAATWANYAVGRALPRETVRRFAGRSLNRVMEILRRRGVLAITALRLVPVAPFAVPGIVAGAAHLSLRDVLIGTVLGNLPGTAFTTILGDRLQEVLADPQPIDYWLLGGVVVAAVLATWAVRRVIARVQLPAEPF